MFGILIPMIVMVQYTGIVYTAPVIGINPIHNTSIFFFKTWMFCNLKFGIKLKIINIMYKVIHQKDFQNIEKICKKYPSWRLTQVPKIKTHFWHEVNQNTYQIAFPMKARVYRWTRKSRIMDRWKWFCLLC